MPGETRVATSPDVVKKFVGLGCDVVIETGAGEGAAFTDADFKEAGATIVPDAAAAIGDRAEHALPIDPPILLSSPSVDRTRANGKREASKVTHKARRSC